ncbi:MAG: hypothetical protein D3903_02650 [Candidatus Electrothrix sp. GM3_4]|nr:hypothetical protein [Candidatus Electrothrix sp. GM3_4]
MSTKYEDVVCATEKTLQQISSFLNIDLTTQDVVRKKIGVVGGSNSSFGNDSEQGAVYTNAVNRWRRYIDTDEQARIEYLLGAYLDKYDYDSISQFSLSFLEKTKVAGYYAMYACAKNIKQAILIKRLLRMMTLVPYG